MRDHRRIGLRRTDRPSNCLRHLARKQIGGLLSIPEIFRYPNMRRWNWLECLAVAVLLATGGCARPAETVPVHGTVLYRGQPLQTGVVAFVSDPQRHSQHVLAVAKLQPDGRFCVEWEGREGIPPGWYRISVICPDARGWPDKYCDPDRSGLECQILPQQTNMLVIRLE
jgi:hypothetical protein